MAGAPAPAGFSHTLNTEYIHNDLINMIAGDREATQSIVDLNMTLFNKVEALEIEQKNLLSSLNLTIDKLAHYERDLSYIRNENDLLRCKLALTEDATRMMYLRPEGLREKHNNNLPQQVALSLSKMGVLCNIADLDYVKRIGKYRENFVRPILIRFIKEGTISLENSHGNSHPYSTKFAEGLGPQAYLIAPSTW